jgi:hypothetical protein
MIIIQGNGFTSPRLTIDVDGTGNALATTGTLVGK